MIRLLLLLLGAEIVRRQWLRLALLGALWAGLGLVIMIDAVDGQTVMRPHDFGYLLLFEGLVILVAGFAGTSRRSYRLTQAAVLIGPGIVIALQPPHGNLVVAVLLGLVLLLDGICRIACALIVRFRAWRVACVGGLVEIGFALASIHPWPVTYEGTIGFDIGGLLVISGIGTLMLARRLYAMPADAPLATLFGSGFAVAPLPSAAGGQGAAGDLVVHVWTPAAAGPPQIRRPLLERYVAAIDRNGAVATGHAALEVRSSLYLSHYPAAELDLAPEDFRRALRAGAENDVAGRFLPSYRDEVADWCEANEHVRFSRFDRSRLGEFWREYSRDTTYNLTNRNCSSLVAHALDAALEGVLGRCASPWRAALRAMATPELWAAGLLRRQAEAMAWTPGFVLDYARLLRIIVEPEGPGPIPRPRQPGLGQDSPPVQPQWAMGEAPPSLTLRRVSASGTPASEISVRTQNTST
jgi:uncharacterized membrane protein HdeD (DUF308 family)